MASKDSSIFYNSQIEICRRHLNAEQFGRLMFALFEVENGGDPEVDDDIVMAFEFMALQKRIDAAKYNAKVQHNREIAKLGGAPKGNQNARKQPKTTQNNPKQPNPKKNNPNDNDNDNDNENENENDNDTASLSSSSIIKYLNYRVGSNYDPEDPDSVELVDGLISRGYDYNDMKKVIDKKQTEWKNDPVMRGYLRPSTLFGSKFTEYLAQPEPMQTEEAQNKHKELEEAREKLESIKVALLAVRADMTDPELIEESTKNLDSNFYKLRDKEALLEEKLRMTESKIISLGGAP